MLLQVGALKEDLTRKNQENEQLLQEVSILRKSLSVSRWPPVFAQPQLSCMQHLLACKPEDMLKTCSRHQQCLPAVEQHSMVCDV